MRRETLFWWMQIICIPLVIIAGILEAIGGGIMSALRRYEDWTFEYSKNGWKHVGDGIWRKFE